jgi:hypothetical protein
LGTDWAQRQGGSDFSGKRSSSAHRATYTPAIEFTREAAYHLLVALPIPSILVGLAFLKTRNGTRVALLAGSLVLFVVIYVVSYMFFCVGCT